MRTAHTLEIDEPEAAVSDILGQLDLGEVMGKLKAYLLN